MKLTGKSIPAGAMNYRGRSTAAGQANYCVELIDDTVPANPIVSQFIGPIPAGLGEQLRDSLIALFPLQPQQQTPAKPTQPPSPPQP